MWPGEDQPAALSLVVLQCVCRQSCQEATMPWLFFTRLASGLAPSATLGGERSGGAWFPYVFAVRLKSLNGKEWQERGNFFVAGLQDGASRLPLGSAGTSGDSVTGRCCLPPPPWVLSLKSSRFGEKICKRTVPQSGEHTAARRELSGGAACHRPWDEQLRRSNSSPGQALPGRAEKLRALRMQLSPFPPPSRFHGHQSFPAPGVSA